MPINTKKIFVGSLPYLLVKSAAKAMPLFPRYLPTTYCSLWAEDVFWYHLAGITLVVIFIKYMVLINRISMIDIFKMGLAVKTGVQTFILLNTILSKEKYYAERPSVQNR